jgi:hypothetical protein
MLNRLAPAAHGLRILIQPLLHGFENVLVLPSCDPAFFGCGALILDCAGLTGVRPVAAHLLPMFLVGTVEFELLAGGTSIDILRRHVDEVLLATLRIAGPLSLRKSAITLSSGTSRPSSHMTSRFRPASRSSRRLDCTRLR